MEKLLKMVYAKSEKARLNYLTDAMYESGRLDSQTDKLLHFFIEMRLGKGTSQERLRSFLKKAERYKR